MFFWVCGNSLGRFWRRENLEVGKISGLRLILLDCCSCPNQVFWGFVCTGSIRYLTFLLMLWGFGCGFVLMVLMLLFT